MALDYVWDYDIDEQHFQEILAGRRTPGTFGPGLGCPAFVGIRVL
jgi:hypothetical protein